MVRHNTSDSNCLQVFELGGSCGQATNQHNISSHPPSPHTHMASAWFPPVPCHDQVILGNRVVANASYAADHRIMNNMNMFIVCIGMHELCQFGSYCYKGSLLHNLCMLLFGCMQALALSCDLTKVQVYRMNLQNLCLLDVFAALSVRERTTEY